MQLSRRTNSIGVCKPFHYFWRTPLSNIWYEATTARNRRNCRRNCQEWGFFSLYRGLGPVLGGIIPKMAIRFTSYEYYKRLLTDKDTMKISRNGIFLGTPPLTALSYMEAKLWHSITAGLAAGITEAVTVVNAVEVIKIHLQALHKSPDGTLTLKYKSTPDALSTLIRTEGIAFLWRGVTLTALRQGTNQAANFTVYMELKTRLQKWQQQHHHNTQNEVVVKDLPSYQITIIGLISGAVGPFFNAPIDTIKTRIQQTPAIPGKSSLSHIITITTDMLLKEGFQSFYKGITPRVMRVAPGQAVTFTVYEFLKGRIEESYSMQRRSIRQTI